MSLANTLSVLLNFKTDMSGLERFVTGLRGRLEMVSEFNKKVQNGAAAVNNVLQATAGYFAVGSLKAYIAEALDARSAQAKLAQALTQTKQNSAAYRSELGDQSSALERLTGLQGELIVGVQRQLIMGGAQRKDIEALTRLTLDFAAAKEIDAVAAAKAVARAVQGEGDELRRYGVEVDLSRNKMAGLIDGLSKFSGQAAEAFGSMPQGMREFQQAAKDAKQSAGEAILAIADPFLNALAGGLKNIKKLLEGISSEGSLVNTLFKAVSSTLGTLTGDNLGKLALLLASLLALRGGGFLVNEVLKTISATFLLLTKQSLPAMLAGLQSLSKEVGILKALSVGGSAGYIALGLTAASVATIGYQIGKAIGEGIDQWKKSNLSKAASGDQRVLDLISNAANADTPEKQQAVFKETEAALAELGAKYRSFQSSFGYTKEGAQFYRQQIFSLRKQLADLSDPNFYQENNDRIYKSRKTAANLESSAFLRSDEADKLHGIVNAGAEARTPLAERLAAAQANLAILDRAFANRGPGDAASEEASLRILAQREVLLAKINDLEKEQRSRQNNDLSRQIAEKDIAIAKVENNNALTDRQKAAQILPLLSEQNQLIAERIALREKELGVVSDDATRVELQAEIDKLRQQLAEKRGRATSLGAPETRTQSAEKGYTDLADPAKHYQTVDEGARGGLLEYLAEVGTMADQIANTIKSTLNSAVSSVGQNISAWVMRTQTWRQTLTNIRQTVMQQMLQSVIQIGVQWLLNEVIIKGAMIAIDALGDLLRAKRVAKENTAEGSMLPLKTANAAATGISSFGTALIFGALAVALILGAMSGFAVGGYTGGGGDKNEVRGPVHAGEWVAPKWMVEDPHYGNYIAGLEAARQGRRGALFGGFLGSGWSSLGQLLGSGGLPKWAALGQGSFQKKWNLLDGTSLYGEDNPGGQVRTLSSADLAQAIATRDSEGSASSAYTGTLVNNSQGPSAAGAASASEGVVVQSNTYVYFDWQALKQDYRRDPASNKHIVRVVKGT